MSDITDQLGYDVPDLCEEHIKAILKAIKKKNSDLRFHFIAKKAPKRLGWLVLDKDGRVQKKAKQAVMKAKAAGDYAIGKQSAGKVKIHSKRLHFLADEVDKIPKLDQAVRVHWPKALKKSKDKEFIKLAAILKRSIVHADAASLKEATDKDEDDSDVKNFLDDDGSTVLLTADEIRALFDEDTDEALEAEKALGPVVLQKWGDDKTQLDQVDERAEELLSKLATTGVDDTLDGVAIGAVKLLMSKMVDPKALGVGADLSGVQKLIELVLDLNKLILAMSVSQDLLEQTEDYNKDIDALNKLLEKNEKDWTKATPPTKRGELEEQARTLAAEGRELEAIRDNTLQRARRQLQATEKIYSQLETRAKALNLA